MNDDPVNGDPVSDVLARALEAALGRPVERDVPLARFSTYRLGGPAALLVEPASVGELLAVAGALAGRDVPVPLLVVGKGSNLLVSEAGFPGLALRLTGELEQLDVAEASVRAGAGLALPVLARRVAAAGRSGLEFYVGIPGTVGGAVRMNAGGHGRETAEVLVRAWVVDLAAGGAGEEARPVETLALSYRRSGLGPSEVVTGAELRAEADDAAACEARIEEIVRWRREHQPGGSNAGSVFTNPPGDAAGRLIEACGLKGHRVGGAVVSEKHANFFQAEPGATADDVRRLVLEVQRTVEHRTGVRLEPELTMVGFPAAGTA